MMDGPANKPMEPTGRARDRSARGAHAIARVTVGGGRGGSSANR